MRLLCLRELARLVERCTVYGCSCIEIGRKDFPRYLSLMEDVLVATEASWKMRSGYRKRLAIR